MKDVHFRDYWERMSKLAGERAGGLVAEFLRNSIVGHTAGDPPEMVTIAADPDLRNPRIEQRAEIALKEACGKDIVFRVVDAAVVYAPIEHVLASLKDVKPIGEDK